MEYRLDHPTKVAEPQPESGNKPSAQKDTLVVFVTFEADDHEGKINPAAKEIRKLARRAEATCIAVNPFSHLSETLAPAETAIELSHKLVTRLQETAGMSVHYMPFGWYKSFKLNILAHDHSQVFRQF